MDEEYADIDLVNAKRLSPIRNLVAGSIGGMFSWMAGQPLDMMKVKLQAQSQTNPIYTVALDCLKKTIKADGIGAIQRYIGPSVDGYTCHSRIRNWCIGQKLQLEDPNQEPTAQCLKADLFCIFCVGFFYGPTERLKYLLPTQKSTGGVHKYNGNYNCLKVFQEGGARSFFMGLGPTLAREIMGEGAWYVTYEVLIYTLRLLDSTLDDVGAISILLAGGVADFGFWD